MQPIIQTTEASPLPSNAVDEVEWLLEHPEVHVAPRTYRRLLERLWRKAVPAETARSIGYRRGWADAVRRGWPWWFLGGAVSGAGFVIGVTRLING